MSERSVSLRKRKKRDRKRGVCGKSQRGVRVSMMIVFDCVREREKQTEVNLNSKRERYVSLREREGERERERKETDRVFVCV